MTVCVSKFFTSPPSRIPWTAWLATLLALLLGTRRAPAMAGAEIWRYQCPAPQLTGAEHMPATGPVLLAVNHYNGPGVWVGLAAGLVARIAGELRPSAPIRGIAVEAYQDYRAFGWLPVPDRLTRLLFARFYHVYDVLAMPRASRDAMARGLAVRRILGALKDGSTVILFPEGQNVENFVMRPLRAGVGDLLRLVARAGVPIVPVGVWEDDGRMTLRLGPPIRLPPRASGGEVEVAVGQAIAALLPRHIRGPYDEPESADHDGDSAGR